MPLTDQDPDVGGTGTVGSPPVGNPVYVGASDGTNLRALLTDTSGRLQAVGPGATGSAPVGNPLFVAGTDGANLRALLMDTSGRQVVIGAAAAGAAVAGNPVLMGGSDGTNAQRLAMDTNGVPIVAPLSYAIAIGRLTGSTGRFAGEVTTNATGTEVAVRATTYTEQTTNAQRSVNSTSASDAAAGIGARTVRITYYSISAGVVTGPFTETVTLNGTTAVNTASSTIAFVESIEMLTVGTNVVNVGAIQLFTTTGGGGSVFASIAATARSTMYCHHYVASTRRAYLTDFLVASLAATAQQPDFHMRSVDLSLANAAERRIQDHIQIQGSSLPAVFSRLSPIVVTGPARITGYVTPSNGTSQLQSMEVGYYEV